MIIDDPKRDVTIDGEFETNSFTIQSSKKAFSILSDKIYTHKVRAVIREISCNAYDAHIDGNNPDPFLVHLPTSLEPWFCVRDYGTGMDHETCMNLYTTYFYSTKTESNDVTGCLGIGSKAPLCLVDSFTVTSYLNGIKRIYSIFKDNDDCPQIANLSESVTNEANGIEIKISIENRAEEFKEEAINVYKHFTQIPDINSQQVIDGIEEYRNTFLLQGNDFGFTPSYGSMIAVMGNVGYKIPSSIDTLNIRGYIEFELGTLSFEPGRENLSLDDKTIKVLEDKITTLKEQLIDLSIDTIKKETTAFKRAIMFERINSSRLSNTIRVHKDKFTEFTLPDTTKEMNSFSLNSNNTMHTSRSVVLPLGTTIKYFNHKPRFTSRIRNYLKQSPDCSEVVLLTDEQITESLIDLDLVEDIDTIPKVVYTRSGGVTSKSKIFIWNGRDWHRGKDNWEEESIDDHDMEERTYVEINRYDIHNGDYTYSTNQLEIIQRELTRYGLTMPVVYGVKTAHLAKKCFKQGNWIKLDEYLTKMIRPIVPTTYTSKKSTNYNATFIQLVDGLDLSKDMDLFQKLSDVYKLVENQKSTKLFEIFELDVEFKESIVTIETELLNKYPMIKFIDEYKLRRSGSENFDILQNYFSGAK